MTSGDGSRASSAFALAFPFPRGTLFAFEALEGSGSRDAARFVRPFRGPDAADSPTSTTASSSGASSISSISGGGERLRFRAFARDLLGGLDDGPATAARPFAFVFFDFTFSYLLTRNGVLVVSIIPSQFYSNIDEIPDFLTDRRNGKYPVHHRIPWWRRRRITKNASFTFTHTTQPRQHVMGNPFFLTLICIIKKCLTRN